VELFFAPLLVGSAREVPLEIVAKVGWRFLIVMPPENG
jgi:hypothetical protein